MRRDIGWDAVPIGGTICAATRSSRSEAWESAIVPIDGSLLRSRAASWGSPESESITGASAFLPASSEPSALSQPQDFGRLGCGQRDDVPSGPVQPLALRLKVRDLQFTEQVLAPRGHPIRADPDREPSL